MKDINKYDVNDLTFVANYLEQTWQQSYSFAKTVISSSALISFITIGFTLYQLQLLINGKGLDSLSIALNVVSICYLCTYLVSWYVFSIVANTKLYVFLIKQVIEEKTAIKKPKSTRNAR